MTALEIGSPPEALGPRSPETVYRVVPAWSRVAEAAPEPLSEAELSRIWAAQSFPAEALTLVDGRRLRVVLPGRPGGGAGPDYRDAIVAIDGVERRGDVELHVRASSFYSHGHHTDPAYANVVLHVVYRADDGPDTGLSDGRRTPVAAFAPWVGQRTGQLQSWLAAPPLWQEPCSDAPARLGGDGVLAVLEGEGRHRFETRRARLRESIDAFGEKQAFWLALLDSLGYGGERAAWRRLAEVLPAALLDSLEAVSHTRDGGAGQTALLAVAGLIQPPAELAGRLPRPMTPPLRGGSRPANRPERRLIALAQLRQRADGDLPGYARRTVSDAKGLRQLTAAWSVASPFGGAALLGEQRARELLLNVVLPLAALDDGLAEKALALAEKLPAAPAYGKTAFLESNLRRADEKWRSKSALQQQGLLAMVGEWCRQGGCGRCPLS